VSDVLGKLHRRAVGAHRWARFALALRNSLRHPISVDDARTIVRGRVEDRQANFLRMVERNIYGHPKSPYLPLLKHAGCDLGDIVAMVRSMGLEDTLRALRRAGVYVTFEEFKGREPIVRNELVIQVRPSDFSNPFISNYYQALSGGTTGSLMQAPMNLSHVAAQAPIELLSFAANNLVNAPVAIWWPVYGGYGMTVIIRGAHRRAPLHRWFSPTDSSDYKTTEWDRLNTFLILALRLSGASVPWPETVRLGEAAIIAHWAAQTISVHKRCVVQCSVSMCTRIALAALSEGLDLTGATFVGGGEPPTPGKLRHIRATGAGWVPYYFFSEAGCAGYGCGNPVDENDLHFARDRLALIQYSRQVPGWDILVDAFNFTSLLPTARMVLLNVESDDYGVIEQRSCGCLLEQEGLTDHLRQVRSFRKLTGEGMTLVGTDMIRILEEVLPARFGGSALDYQLVEEEDADGFTRLALAISPRIEISDEKAVIEAVLGNLRNFPPIIWRQAGSLKVKRVEPVWTARGKLMPLHLDRRTPTATSV